MEFNKTARLFVFTRQPFSFLMGNNNPVGVFDSGIGGLSVWREILKILPNESIVYYADSKNCPYGQKSEETIISLAKRAVEFLLEKNAKLLVVACNTATAAAIDLLRSTYNIPFVGMEPAIKPAALNSKSGIIGVLATEGTFNGRLFNETKVKYAKDKDIIIRTGHGLAELVETGKENTPEAAALLRNYIQPMLEKQADHIVLGCTHYPFLLPAIKKIVKDTAIILDPAPAVAKQTASRLKQHKLEASIENRAFYHFYTNTNTEILKKRVQISTGTDNLNVNITSLKT